MNKYIGTKEVTAKPMTRGEYNIHQGWTLPVDQNPNDKGYLMEYVDGGKPNHKDHKGYISWSPAEVFENACSLVDTWYDRIKLELAGEQDKLEKLTATLKEERPSFVDEGQWVLMFSQQFHMRMYVQYLEKRIALADGETVDLVDSAVSHGSESNLT